MLKNLEKYCSEGKVDIIYKSFPIQTPRTDCSEFSNIVAILATFCYTKNLHECKSFIAQF